MELELSEVIQKEQTAFYVFDSIELEARITRLREAFRGVCDLCYAVKANTFLIPMVLPLVERVEICSPGELVICKELGVESHKQVVSGVYKTPAVMEQLVADESFAGIFTIESETQYEMLLELARQYERTIPVLLRVTNDSQFGLEEGIVKAMIEKREETKNLRIVGLQYFSGTQKTSGKKLKRELQYLDMLLQTLSTDYGYEAEELEYGPGLPYRYFVSDEFSEDTLFFELRTALQERTSGCRVILELGRSIAASCGTYYTHVVDQKRNKEQNYLLVDGGMHQLVYYGQYMAMKRPFFRVVGKETDSESETYTICGSLCSMNDILVKQVAMPKTTIGDVLAFHNTGAYSVTEGIALFLSRELPAIYVRRPDGTLEKVREHIETAYFNTPRKG